MSKYLQAFVRFKGVRKENLTNFLSNINSVKARTITPLIIDGFLQQRKKWTVQCLHALKTIELPECQSVLVAIYQCLVSLSILLLKLSSHRNWFVSIYFGLFNEIPSKAFKSIDLRRLVSSCVIAN